MPVSLPSIISATEALAIASCDTMNLDTGDISNTGKSTAAQSDEVAAEAQQEAIDSGSTCFEELGDLTQLIIPIVAELRSIIARVNAKLKPYEDKVARAEAEQDQIASSNVWYADAKADENAKISNAESVIAGADPEAANYDSIVSSQQTIITNAQNLINTYNNELSILNGDYSSDWEEQRAYHQAIVDDIIATFNAIMSPVATAFNTVNGYIVTANTNIETGKNTMLDAAAEIAKNIAKTAGKAVTSAIGNIAENSPIMEKSEPRSGPETKPELPPAPEPEDPFIATDNVLTFSTYSLLEQSFANKEFSSQRLVRVNDNDGELYIVENSYTSPKDVNTWEEEWREKTGKGVDVEDEYGVINNVQGERKPPVDTTDSLPDGIPTYTSPSKDKSITIEGKLHILGPMNPTTDIISGADSNERSFNEHFDEMKPFGPIVEAAKQEAVAATAGLGGFDKDLLDAAKTAKAVEADVKEQIETAKIDAEFNKFDFVKVTSNMMSGVAQGAANTAKGLADAGANLLDIGRQLLIDTVAVAYPLFEALIARPEPPLLSDPSPDITGGARISGTYSADGVDRTGGYLNGDFVGGIENLVVGEPLGVFETGGREDDDQ